MKFYIKQKVFTLKDKFKITDESQSPLYEVKGKFMSITNKLELLDLSENVLYRSNRKVLTLLAKYFIYNQSGEEVAMIKRKFSLRPKFDLSILGKEMELEGSLFAHSFNIIHNGQSVAAIRKKIISWGDAYEIEIYDNKDIELYLFVIIILDQVIHEKKR
jgi:uncharacterized protein YxjI